MGLNGADGVMGRKEALGPREKHGGLDTILKIAFLGLRKGRCTLKRAVR